MNNKIIFKIIIGALLISGVVCLNYWLCGKQNKAIVWVNLSNVYNEFDLKKELEGKFRIVQTERKKILDSLELNLKVLGNQVELTKGKDETKLYEFQMKREEYLTKKEQFEQDNAQLQGDYNQQVLTQINQYVKEYALSNNYSYVLGADGTGALMFAEDGVEVTKDVLVYINNKYKGIN
jgi:outer membrane protein